MKNLIFSLLGIILISACVGGQQQTTATSAQAAATTAPSSGSGLPDIIVSDIEISKGASNARPLIKATIKNSGSKESEAGTAKINIKNSGGISVSAETHPLPALPAGASTEISSYPLSKDLASGSYSAVAEVDSLNQVAESNERNNIEAKSFSIPLP